MAFSRHLGQIERSGHTLRSSVTVTGLVHGAERLDFPKLPVTVIEASQLGLRPVIFIAAILLMCVAYILEDPPLY